MKRIIRILVLCGLLANWIVSCKSVNINIPTSSPTASPGWWNSWLVEPVCKPPCWRNITPGVTTIEEATSILENSPDVKITYSVNNGIEWDFTPSNSGGGWIKGYQDEIIDTIKLGGDSAILLRTIIASYGDPEYVWTYDCRNYMCATFLIYTDLGMSVDVFVENAGRDNQNPQIEILPELVSNDVFFIEPGMENFQRETSFPDYGPPMEWKGYGVYP